jgi:hypothetical protein
MADHDADQGDRRNKKRQQRQQSSSRAGDVTLDDSFATRFLFRLATDASEELGLKIGSVPLLKAGIDTLIGSVGLTGTSLAVNAVAAALQNPRLLGGLMSLLGAPQGAQYYLGEVIDESFDGLRRSIRTERVGDQEVHKINLNEADAAIAAALEKKRGKKPIPAKTYFECFQELLPLEQRSWDQALATFTPAQKAEFEKHRALFIDVKVFRTVLLAMAPKRTLHERAAELVAFLARHSGPPKPKGLGDVVGDIAPKLGMKVAKAAQKVVGSIESTIDKIGEPLTVAEQQRIEIKRAERKQKFEALEAENKNMKW